jgi:SAM-dependent methyltransferase
MRDDITRWNEKFSRRDIADTLAPDPLLVECEHLPAAGSAVDIACGTGHDAVWLATRGLAVTCVDGSIEGMRLALALARRHRVTLTPIVADLDACPLAGRFDLVIVMHYLNRPLYRSLPQRLKAGGILVVKTFNTDFLEHRPNFNPDYVLARDELPGLLPNLEILDYAQSPRRWHGKTHIVCRKP